MTNATQTLAGDIQLAGDLAGSNNAAAPTLTNTAVTPGTYTLATITVDAKGRITSASNGTAGILTGDVNGILPNTVLTTTGVTAGTYSAATITVDSKGRITAASSATLGGDVSGSISSTSLSTTGVTAGSYTNANITVDAKGRVSAASNGTAATVGGDVTGTIGNIQLATSGVSAGSYTNANITVDAKGRITSASNGSVAVGGELTGTISNAQLTTTGVTAGSYTNANFTVNSKGRISAASNGSAATTATLGVVQIDPTSALAVDAFGVLSINKATSSSAYGVVKSANTSNITITAGAINVGANVPLLNTTNTFTKVIRSAPYPLTSASTIIVDGTQSNIFTLTLGINATIYAPTVSGSANTRYSFIITQDSTGSRTLAFNSGFKFPTGADTIISSAANSVSIVECVAIGSNLYCSLAKNFA